MPDMTESDVQLPGDVVTVPHEAKDDPTALPAADLGEDEQAAEADGNDGSENYVAL
jgi:hypothetical protein